jgi:hypothetical protein
MPPKNYSNITVRREIREELEKLRGELKVRDFSDLLALLVAKYREYTSVTSKLLQQLTSISSKVDELLTRVSSTATSVSSISVGGGAQATSVSSSTTSVSSISTNGKTPATDEHNIGGNIMPSTTDSQDTQSGAKGRRSAFDIFMERGYTFFSDLAKSRRVKDPGRVYESIKRNAVASKVRVVECDLEGDKVLIRADVWDAFKRKLGTVKSPDDRAVLDALKEEWEKKLYTLLVRSGGVHFDYKSKEWVFDSKVVREVEESEEEYAEDWEIE